MPSALHIQMLSIELAPLRALANKHPGIGAAVEALLASLRGVGGVTDDDVEALRSCAGKWKKMRPELRDFITACLDVEGAAGACATGWVSALFYGRSPESEHVAGLIQEWRRTNDIDAPFSFYFEVR